MRELVINYRRGAQEAEGAGYAQSRAGWGSSGGTPRCTRHPGVLMVLAGTHREHNTVRYLCPLCQAMNLPTLEVAQGEVQAYFPERGYGFIDAGGPRIFFHISDVAGGLQPRVGLAVICQVETSERGLAGKQVRAR